MEKLELYCWLYETMLKIRYFEEAVIDVYARGLMPGIAHLYIGEEAVAAGACKAIEKEDYITSTHRGHGHCIAKGGDLNIMMAELFGKKTGYCKGKGGSMHIADMSLGILGANGVVGGGIPIATGSGLASKINKNGRVTLCFLGDGASNQGSFHESLNMASLYKLPVIYIVENNEFGISLHQSRHQAIKDIADRGAAYGMPGKVIDGNNVMDVYAAVMDAVSRARRMEGPTLIECKTYRWRGHSEGDANLGARYRDRQLVEVWKEKCPLRRFEAYLKEQEGFSEEYFNDTKNRVEKAIDDAIDFAKNSPDPEIEVAYEDVYYGGIQS